MHVDAGALEGVEPGGHPARVDELAVAAAEHGLGLDDVVLHPPRHRHDLVHPPRAEVVDAEVLDADGQLSLEARVAVKAGRGESRLVVTLRRT